MEKQILELLLELKQEVKEYQKKDIIFIEKMKSKNDIIRYYFV